MTTIAGWRDRLGHTIVLTVLAVAVVSAAPAKAYKAPRYDVELQVLPGGDLRVTETIVIDFQQGTFDRFWRDLRTNRTDGIEIEDATLDGRSLPRGQAPGQVAITGTSRIRVEWELGPTGASTHTFGLRYIARGVGRTIDGRDVIEWQPLPSEHRYMIDAGRVTVRAPQAPADAPSIDARRVDHSSIALEEGRITAVASGIQSNGWISLKLAFAPGQVVARQPQWEQRRQAQTAMGPRWVLSAAVVFAAGLALVLLMRAGYTLPESLPDSEESGPPDALPPALASALVGHGDARRANAVATLLDLAQRGAVAIQERPRRMGVRTFSLAQVPGSHDLAPHETAAIRIAFADAPDEVTLAKARGRLGRGGRRFSAAVSDDLASRGLLDPSRKAVRDRLVVTGVSLLLAGTFGAVALTLLIEAYGPWPLTIGLAVVLAGFVGVLTGVSTSALSDEGARQASRWRGFKSHLKQAARRGDGEGDAPAAWAIYAAALGLGYTWARYMKKHPGAVPEWFDALDPAQASAAWVAFVGSAGAHGGGAGGGSGAAGGGGSGAA